jgi:TonB family protein
MNTIGPDDTFASEEELRALLEKWQAPEPSQSLDMRVSSSYLRETSLKESVLFPKMDNEVVAMKFCSTCQEEYADKFSFCPVDATPLRPVVVRHEETTPSPLNDNAVILPSEPEPAFAGAAFEAVSSSSSLVQREEYHLTIMDDTGLAQRLTRELRDVAHEYELTWPEFKRDPVGFVKRSAVGYGQMARRFLANRNILIAMGTALVAMIALVGAIRLLDASQSAGTSRIGIIAFAVLAFFVLVAMFATWLGRERGAAVMGAQPSDSRSVAFAMVTAFVFIFAILGLLIYMDHRRTTVLAADKARSDLVVEQFIDIPQSEPTPDPGPAGFNKGSGGGSKPKQEKPGGGGGGGREDPKPASAGKLPQASLTVPQILPPDPKPPTVKNPSLPVPASVNADPMLVPPDPRVAPYGDPKSKSTDPSSGPGKGGGIGNGTGTGVGPGEGNGVGPGRGGNIGGGDYHPGGGGPGGGGGGTDYNKVFNGRDVTQKARILSKPEPNYTEEARKNQITGTVVLKAVFTSGGAVTQISTVRGLPDGLTERAIAAARNIKFIPATKDGHPVSMYMQLEYSFNLY